MRRCAFPRPTSQLSRCRRVLRLTDLTRTALFWLLLTAPGFALGQEERSHDKQMQISGIVLPANGDRSVPVGTLVELRDQWGSNFVSYVSQGRFSFSNVPANSYTLSVRAEGYQTVHVPLDGRNAGERGAISLDIRLVKGQQPEDAERDSHVVTLQTLAIPPKALRNYEKGVKQLKSGHFESALSSIDRAIKLHPEFAEAHAARGATLMKLRRAGEAETALCRAVELNSSLFGARKYLGYLLLVTMRYEEAVDHLSAALSIGPADSSLLAYLGEGLYHLERYQEAYGILRQSLELDPENYQAYYRQGFVCLKLQRRAEAVASFQDFLAYNQGWDDSDVTSLLEELSRSHSSASRRSSDLERAAGRLEN
jgi:tetratricopeptide (TPR) repeat protein